MSVVKWHHRAIVLYPCLFLKGCMRNGSGIFLILQGHQTTRRSGSWYLGVVVLRVFDVLFMCVIEHVLWNNGFLETSWCLKGIHYLLFFTFFLPRWGLILHWVPGSPGNPPQHRKSPRNEIQWLTIIVSAFCILNLCSANFPPIL